MFVCVIWVCNGGGGNAFLSFWIALSGWYATYVHNSMSHSMYWEVWSLGEASNILYAHMSGFPCDSFCEN